MKSLTIVLIIIGILIIIAVAIIIPLLLLPKNKSTAENVKSTESGDSNIVEPDTNNPIQKESDEETGSECIVGHNLDESGEEYIYGGWCMNAQISDFPTSGGNTICAGNFSNLSSNPPDVSDYKYNSITNRWMTIGGDNVQGDTPTAEQIVSWISEYGYTGVDFDYEGDLASNNDFAAWIL